jgi:hypothetical protein
VLKIKIFPILPEYLHNIPIININKSGKDFENKAKEIKLYHYLS